MESYPLTVNLEGVPVAVIGGGEVAARKIGRLLRAGARLTVISPSVTARVESLRREGRLRLIRRPYRDGDLEGFLLAFAAADDSAANTVAAGEAARRGVLFNNADGDTKPGGFSVPAVARRGDLTVAVTAGGLPLLSARLREYLDAKLPPQLSEEVQRLQSKRKRILREAAEDSAGERGAEKRRDEIRRSLEADIEGIIEMIDGQ